MESWEKICLAAIGIDQDAVKKTDHALNEVIKNIADPNTDAWKKRSVVLKIEMRPTQDRRAAEITYRVETKLAGDAPGMDHVVIGRDGTGHVSMMDQLDLPGPQLEAKDGGKS
jgi:hypothetical protein